MVVTAGITCLYEGVGFQPNMGMQPGVTGVESLSSSGAAILQPLSRSP